MPSGSTGCCLLAMSMIMHVACATLLVVSSLCITAGESQVLGGVIWCKQHQFASLMPFLLHSCLLQAPSQTWLMHWTGTLK
jgi:hypothetical protein